MRSDFIFLGIAAFLISSCSGGTGPTYHQADIESHKVQLVIYHPAENIGSLHIGAGPDVKINDVVACALPNGSYFVTSAKPGNISISSDKTMMIGTSHLTFRAQAGKRYYVRVTWSQTRAYTGLIGQAISGAANYGPFDIEIASEETALPELANIKAAICR